MEASRRNLVRYWGFLAVTVIAAGACGPETAGIDALVDANEPQLVERVDGVTTATYEGQIFSPGDRITHNFYLSEGGSCVFETTLGTLDDSVISLYGPDDLSRFIAQNDDIGSGNYASRIQVRLVPGAYSVVVRAFNESHDTGTYWLTVTCSVAVRYQSHVEGYGWMGWVFDGQQSGTTGEGRRVEAIKIQLAEAPNVSIRYRVHIGNVGWTGEYYDGQVAGTTGQHRRMEAVQIWLANAPPTCGVSYQAHVQGVGWQGIRSNGQTAGTTGQNRRLEAIKIWLTGTCQ